MPEAATLFKETPFRAGQKTLIIAQDAEAVEKSLFPMYDRFNTHYRMFRNVVALPKLVSNRKEWQDQRITFIFKNFIYVKLPLFYLL